MRPEEYGYISVIGMGLFAIVVGYIAWSQDRREKRNPPTPPEPK